MKTGHLRRWLLARFSIISPLASPLGAAQLALQPPSIWPVLIGLPGGILKQLEQALEELRS